MRKVCPCGRTGRARLNHTAYECWEQQAKNAGPVAYAQFILKSAEEGRLWISDDVRARYEAQANV